MLRTAKSPRTDNRDGAGANTSSLTVVAKSLSTHRDLTSLPFIRLAQPVSKIDLSGGISVSLIQEYSCRSFICLISRSSPALILSAGTASIKVPQISHCPHHGCEEPFLPLVPCSTRLHRPLVPVDEMSLVLFRNCPRPSGQAGSRCLSQRSFLSSSAREPSSFRSGPVVVCLELQHVHVSPPPLMLFGGSRPRHLDIICIRERVTSPDRESRVQGIQEFCRFLTRRLRS